jgi:hypothetical protein
MILSLIIECDGGMSVVMTFIKRFIRLLSNYWGI